MFKKLTPGVNFIIILWPTFLAILFWQKTQSQTVSDKKMTLSHLHSLLLSSFYKQLCYGSFYVLKGLSSNTFLADFRTPCRSSPMWHLKIFSWIHVLPCVTWHFHKRLCFFQYFLWWNFSKKMSHGLCLYFLKKEEIVKKAVDKLSLKLITEVLDLRPNSFSILRCSAKQTWNWIEFRPSEKCCLILTGKMAH